MWKKIQRLSKEPATLDRVAIAKALSLAAAGSRPGRAINVGKIDSGIESIEPLLTAKRWNLATVEAALDLSRLYVLAKRFDEAGTTLDGVVARLSDPKAARATEIPPALAKAFLDAAKAARRRLTLDANAGLAEFQAAEKLRKAGRFVEASRAYQAIVKKFPASEYAPRSELHIGDCLIGLGRDAQAIAHWEKFIAPLPAGPWR
ncbi:MAG: tetratricopeptide repeat protein, partial [bacterium]|nr:tetratricopeptide repeat protein [bacterium]